MTDPILEKLILKPSAKANSLPINHLLTIAPLLDCLKFKFLR